MQVIWCLKFFIMTKSGGTIPPLQILGGLVFSSPVIYAHGKNVNQSSALYKFVLDFRYMAAFQNWANP